MPGRSPLRHGAPGRSPPTPPSGRDNIWVIAEKMNQARLLRGVELTENHSVETTLLFVGGKQAVGAHRPQAGGGGIWWLRYSRGTGCRSLGSSGSAMTGYVTNYWSVNWCLVWMNFVKSETTYCGPCMSADATMCCAIVDILPYFLRTAVPIEWGWSHTARVIHHHILDVIHSILN